MSAMTVTEAARVWLAHKAKMAALKDESKAATQAADVLKAYFRKSGKRSYRGVGYKVDAFTALDPELVREKLGKRVGECEVPRTRESLFPLKPEEGAADG